MHTNNILWIIIRRMRIPFLVIIVTFTITILGLVLIPGVDGNGHPYHMSFLDAFYFVSFMASTIGFGEVPYEFTYAQRLWVLFSIYTSVIGWFYAIGTIVALVQDNKLLTELKVSKFSRKIRSLKEPFVIILGYNNTTRELIHKLNLDGKRIVVVDRSQDKIDELELENFIPEIYSIKGDIQSANILKLAGITKKNCKAFITLFDNDFKNTKMALLAKLLNENLNIIVKSTTREQTEHLTNLGIKNIIDPFQFVSNRFGLALSSPNLWILEMLLFEHESYIREYKALPHGKYIICGYGRMGKAIKESLDRAGIDCSLIDLKSSTYKAQKKSAIFGDEQDHRELLDAGIKDAKAIVAATKDDLINLTILLTAKKINPDIYTIGRENTLEDVTIFNSAKIDRVYILEEVISEHVHRLVSMPLTYIFLKELYKQSNEWGEAVAQELKRKTNYKPELFEVGIVESEAHSLVSYLKDGNSINLEVLTRCLSGRAKKSKIMFLLVKNEEEQNTLLPDDNYELKINDRILIASTLEAKDNFLSTINNHNDLYYVLNGMDYKFGVFKYFAKSNKDVYL